MQVANGSEKSTEGCDITLASAIRKMTSQRADAIASFQFLH